MTADTPRADRGAAAGFGLLVGGVALLPLVIRDPFVLGLLATGFALAIAVYGLDLLLGRGGQLSLGHAGFFGVGGYAQGVLTTAGGFSFWTALPLSLAGTMGLGYLVSLGALRTRADAFAIFTLAVGVMIRIVIERWEGLTGGTDGLVGIPPPPRWGPLEFQDPLPQYYLALAFLLLTMQAVRSLGASPFGRRLEAVHRGEDTSMALGIDPGATLRTAFVVAVGMAALSGALYATLLGFIGPALAGVTMSFLMLSYLMVGGVGTLAGPLLGTLVVTLLVQGFQLLEGRQMMLLGGVLVLLMIHLPGGLAGLGFRRATR